MKKINYLLFFLVACLMMTQSFAYAMGNDQGTTGMNDLNKERVQVNVTGTTVSFDQSRTSKVFKTKNLYQIDFSGLRSVASSNELFEVNLQLGEEHNWSILLEHHDMRSANYQEIIGTESGNIVAPQRRAITYKGYSNSDNGLGEAVRLNIADSFINGFVTIGGQEYFIEPLSITDDRAPSDYYVVYRPQDVTDEDEHTCTYDAVNKSRPYQDGEVEFDLQNNRVAAVCLVVETATACTWDFVTIQGTPQDANDRIAAITNLVEGLYDPFMLLYEIVGQFAPASEAADPFTTSDIAEDLLDAMQAYAPTNLPTHDVGQIWTGRNIRGCYTGDDPDNFGLIGCAMKIGDVCGSERYNVCENWNGITNCLRTLSAHEFGHTWDGVHGQSAAGSIMFPSINCNAVTFTAGNTTRIQNHIDSRDCLLECNCGLEVSCALINDITVACQEDVPTLEQDQVVILDACGDVSFTAISGITPGTGCPGDPIFIGRSITATDQAGNSETCSQTVTIISNEGPSITCPATMVETCIEDFDEIANRAMVTASAECGVAAISLVSGPVLDVPGIVSNCNGATYTVTYRAEDDCGRSAECEQQIAVVNDPPTIECPANAVIECEDEIMPAMDDVMVVTSCDVGSTVTFSDPVMIGQANCDLTVYQVTYTVTDVCGRQASCTQSLTIENEGPSITIPADMTLACDEPTDPGEGGGVAVASYTGAPQGWPDGGVGSSGLVATLTANVSGVPAGAVITDVNVSVAADHSWIGDLEVDLISPDNTSIRILEDPCNNGNSDNVDVTFDDEGAAFNCTSGVVSDTGTPDDCSNDYLGGAAISGSMQPQLGVLSDFDGENPNGTWTLEVNDDAGGDGGCFSEFEVIVSYAIPGDGTGTATAIASCDLEVEVTFEDEVDVTVCEGGTILRTWTATDDCGRAVSEVQTLTILPALAPVITSCPGPQTVECPEDIVTTPEAVVATLDCGVTAETTVAGPVIDGPEACPGTTYTYTYTVTDECGRIDQCQQVFTIGENDGPTIDVVPTITVDCFESINPDPNFADVTTACGNGVDFEVTVTDPVLGFGQNCPGETYSVVYTITDACGRSASATQTFVIDNEGPTMECPDNCEVLTCYEGDYEAIIEAWINTVEATSSCSVDLTVFNTYNGVNGICVDNGFTPVTFSATDACGRSVSCESGIFITDTDAPDIYETPEDLLVPCTANTEQIFSDWLADYGGAEAVDACGGPVTWSADTGVNALNCANGPQAIVVTFTATDGCGNSASVVGTFNTKLLPNAVNVAGLIQTEAAEAVASVEVAAYQSSGMTEMDMSTQTGDYHFEELPYEENTEIVPNKDDDYLNGVTTYDLILLQQHILGIQTLNSPYKQIAADANRSGTISTLDLVLLRRLILHIDEELADNTSWRFVDADFVFPNADNPFETDFPEVYTLSGLEEELKDFVAVKIGDLNLDAWTSSFSQGDDRSGLEELQVIAEDQKLAAGQEYSINLSAANFASINGFQFTLNFDQNAIEIMDITSADLADFGVQNFGMSKADEGAVTISWNSNTAQDLAKQDAMFTVVLRAESAAQLSEVLSIGSAYTKAEAYQGGELMNVSLNFSDNGTIVTAQSLKLYQNQPNPFKATTTIGFQLPEASEVTLEIYDVAGKLLHAQRGNFAAGFNQIDVNRAELQAGILYYHLSTATDAQSKKMIVLE